MDLSEYSTDNLNIFKEKGSDIIYVNGIYALNAATERIQLPSANINNIDVLAPMVCIFQDIQISGYGYVNIGRGTNSAYVGISTAVTYAIIAFSYKGH